MIGRWVTSFLALTIAGTGLVACGGGSGSGDGPLSGGVVGFTYPVDVGDLHSIGQYVLTNEGDEPATIVRVRFVDVAGTFEILGVRTRVLPSEAGIFFGDKGFPPSDFPAKPLAEQDLVAVPTTRTPEGDPDATLELVIGVRMPEPGVARSRGLEIFYKVGDQDHRELIDQPLTLCAPIAEYVGQGKECPPKNLSGDFGDKIVE